MPPRRVIYSPEARIDISQIRQFSVEQWGPNQARRFMRRLRASLSSLGAYPEIGRVVSPERPDRRQRVFTPYIVYYRTRDSHIEISRIIHERREGAEPFD